eukprot:8541548-Pyramimonas_sp.AAC.1
MNQPSIPGTDRLALQEERVRVLAVGDGPPLWQQQRTLGLPTDRTASGQTKSETTCKFVKHRKKCPEAGQGCPCSHQKPKTPAAPAQPGAGNDQRAASGKNDRRGRNESSGSKGPKGKDRPRSSTLRISVATRMRRLSRTRSHSETSRERQSKMACYAYSRDPRNCKAPRS